MCALFILLPLLSLFIGRLAQSNIDVLHYKFNIELNNNNDSFMGKPF